MNEIWKDVVGYEGLYRVNQYGVVQSMRYNPPKDIYQRTTNVGYKQVALYKYGKAKKFGVHRLVALAFVDGYKDGLEVNHKDANKLNNYFENLEWVDRTTNQKHQYKFYHPTYEPKRCKICGRVVSGNKMEYCSDCIKDVRRKNWQSKEELAEEILKYSIEEIGRQYNCSDNTIRKRLRAYGLPVSKKEIIEYQKEHGAYVSPKRANVKPFEERYKMYEIDGIKKTANAWSIWLGLDSKRIGRYANKHSYDETIEYIRSFMK